MEDFSKCRGIRVFYYPYPKDRPSPSGNEFEGKDEGVNILNDHEHQWKDYHNDPKEIHLEAGTVTSVVLHKNEEGKDEFLTVIRWDCGLRRCYCEGELENIRVFDLGPTGFKGEQVICDICLEPVMGYAWSLASTQTEDSFTLCCAHYNKYRNVYSDYKFCSHIPGYDAEPNQMRDAHGQVYLYGLFKGAQVRRLKKDRNNEGTILQISHSTGDRKEIQTDIKKANYFKCCAEVLWSEHGLPDFYSVACQGIVELKAVIPAKWMKIYADHHPILEVDLFKTLASFEANVATVTPLSLRLPRKNLETIESHLNQTKVELEHLKTINIYDNKIYNLPAALENASQLAVFCGQDNCFNTFPKALLNLNNLTTLNLHGNHLSDLPRRFQRPFGHLHRLFLSNNDLNYLPDIFDSFPVLTEASFAHNHLTVLPSSFKNLSKLRRLNLSYNAIARFPDSFLCGVGELKYLDLRYNRIQKLPAKQPELRAIFQRLKSIKLKGNPIYLHGIEPTLEMLQKENVLNTYSKINLLQSQRICVFGNKKVGKTSLVRSVCYDEYVFPNTEHHHKCGTSIDCHYAPLKLKSDCVVPLHVWDHAGQDELNEYGMISELSITNYTLLWVVVSLDEYECKIESFKECVLKWVYPILRKSTNPLLWIVGTHFDSTSSENKLSNVKKYFSKFCKEYNNALSCAKPDNSEARAWLEDQKSVLEYLLKNVQYFELSNTRNFKGRENLLETIKDKLQWGHSLSSEWETEIHEEIHQKGSAIFDSNQVHILNLASAASVPDRNEFLNYCCGIGEIYRMESKPTKMSSSENEKYFTNMQWLVKRLQMVSEKKLRCCINRHVRFAIDMFNDNGAIALASLSELWACQDSLSGKCLAKFLTKYSLTFQFEMHNQEEYLFFPYLIKSKERPSSTKDRVRIDIECVYPLSLPQHFLFRLALLLDCGGFNFELAQNWFKVKLKGENGQYVDVLGSKRTSILDFSNSIMLQFSYPRISYTSENKDYYDGLWTVVVDALKLVDTLLLEEPCKFDMQCHVLCPGCESDHNSLTLIHLPKAKDRDYLLVQKRQCTHCDKTIPLYQLVPQWNHQMCSAMSQEEFNSHLSPTWKAIDENPEFSQLSTPSSQYTTSENLSQHFAKNGTQAVT